MAEPLFDHVAAALERRTSLVRLEARGTLRLVLKAAGLDPRSVTREQMQVVLQRLMPGELAARGIESAEQVCDSLAADLAGFSAAEDVVESPEAVFARLAGSD